MSGLVELIIQGESTLIRKIVKYARETGYSNYTPANSAVWQTSVKGLSAGLIAALETTHDLPDLSPEIDLVNNTATAFGVTQAQQHRSRGISLVMFLGLMKYFRQSYHDLIDEKGFPVDELRWAHTFTERYFDMIELGFIVEWERSADEHKKHHEQLILGRNAELSYANEMLRKEVNERKRAEKRINHLNAELEQRVEIRTQQLKRINEQNDFKLKELLILNRLSSLNLSSIRLNRLSEIILSSLTSNPPLFFDRAMLFLLNERTQVLQGMLGVLRDTSDPTSQNGPHHHSGESLPDDTVHDSLFNTELRSCRIELKKGRNIFYRSVAEKRVIVSTLHKDSEQELPEFFSQLQINSFAVMPLMGKNGIFGVIIVDNPLSCNAISRSDLKFLQLFSKHAGIAIQNLMLFCSLEDANRRLQETQEQLVHGERLATIGEMAASIAHELKGPMVAIGGFAGRLAKKIQADSIEAGYVATIIAEERRLEKMLDDVLSFSKKTTTCYESCSITEVLENSLSILSHIFDKNGVVLHKSFSKKDLPLYADCQQLKQVFINLLHNALDAMKTGGTLRISVGSAKLGKKRAVAVKISDTGAGIADTNINSIFTPFFTTKMSGTGLGLPIASRIIFNHNGKIRARNHAGGGAEFTVLLPCYEDRCTADTVDLRP